MWDFLLTWLAPTAVAVYGLTVLVTGRVGGPGARAVRGGRAPLLGVVLVAVLPLAIVLGPHVRFGPFAPRLDAAEEAREAEIVRDILADYQALEEWRKEHEPPPALLKPADLKTVGQIDARRRALDEFTAEYDRRYAETEARVQVLSDEQGRLEEQRNKAKRRGSVWVALGLLLIVWAAAVVMGRKH